MMFEPWMNQEMKRKSRKQSQENEKTDDQTNFFDQLLYEIVVDIVSRLPITSLIQFSFVSRSSNSLCQYPHVVNTHLSRSSMDGSSSCLILHSNYPLQNQLRFLQLCDGKLRKLSIPFVSWMPEFSILGSSNGVLCLINTSFPESIYLYNPFTRNHVEISKNLDFQGQIVVYGYGFSPATNDYKVIKIAYYTRGVRRESEVQIYSLRCNVWEKRGVVPYILEKWSSPGVVVSGRVHWVSGSSGSNRDEKMIVSCDLADDSFHVVKQPGSFCDHYGRRVSCQLAALDGCLCAAIPLTPGFGAFDVWIMKEYGVTESWMKAYSVGVYCPAPMISRQMERSSHIWRSMYPENVIQIMCELKSGELLLEYKGAGLVSYDSRSKTFKELKFHGMPRLYQATFHVGSLKSANL